MKILIIILCIALLYRNPKEGFWNDIKKKLKKLKEQIEKCAKRLLNFNNIARERAQWRQKVNDLKNSPKYRDPNFNQDFYDFYRNDLTALNNNINENTQLNNDLNSMLKRIKILQINNKRVIDLLKTENTNLKECKINKELTDNDYDVLT
jgi:DNA-directed RNA polymerase specialized sigma subunit